MLKGIDPVLSPELLKALAEMGHEDAILLVDANFTAMRYRASTTNQQVIRLPGVGLARAAQAVLSVLPLGTSAEQPVRFMQVTELPQGQMSAVQREVVQLLPADRQGEAITVERFAFYELALQSYVIVQTGELQPYGNVMLKKGVICEPLR
jgi:L-fucose mutarotase